MWLIIAILLPIGFVAAWQSVPEAPQVETESVFTQKMPQYPEVFASGENELLKVNLRFSAKDSAYQLETITKEALTHASYWLYLNHDSHANVSKSIAIGALTEATINRFPIETPMYKAPTIVVYDEIKKKPISKIDLQKH